MKTLKSIPLLFILSLVISSYMLNNSAVPKQDLTNTTWKISYDNDKGGKLVYEIRFENNGKLGNTHPNDNTKDNDFWKQKGNNIVLMFNNKYVVYKGKLVTENKIVGKAKNEVGKQWEWEAIKIK